MILLVVVNTTSFAGEDVLNRKIVDIGCHLSNDTCYVTLSGTQFGSAEKCIYGPSTEFRFGSGTPHGKRVYASLLAAFLAKKTVDAYITGCFEGRITLEYFHIR